MDKPVLQLMSLLLPLLHCGCIAEAAAVAATTAAPSSAVHHDSAGAHGDCVLGALICLHQDLRPYLLTALWLLFLAVLLLVFERSELPRCMDSPSEPSSFAAGSERAQAAAAKARARSRRVRAFCNRVLIRGVKEYLPTSCLQILLGLIFAGVVQLSGYHVAHLENLEPNLFFRFLLPIIIINAGLGVDKDHFFFNLPAILAYAVLGTIVVALGVGYCIYGLAAMNPGPFPILKNVTKIEALTFGALISAVDPVAVLAVFERMHLNKPLYITLFGESVLNDAVSVVLYNLFNKAGASMAANATEWHPTSQEIAGTALYSVHVALTGLVIGVACGLLASGLLRVLPNAGNQHLAVIIVVVFGYISFYLAEFIAASGIVSTFIYAMVVPAYFANLTSISYAFLRQSTKSYAEISEGFVYLVLGISALQMLFNSNAKFIVDVPFILMTLLLCLVLRFACVYGIGYLLKALHLTELCAGDFFILAYGGLRGAIALALSLMLREERRRFADVFLTCTMVMVLLTCFVYGITLKPLIKAMKIQAENNDEHLFGQINSGDKDPLRYRPLTKRFYNWLSHINNTYLKRVLLKKKVFSKTHAGSMLKVATESDSLDGISAMNSNPTIYVIGEGSSGCTLSQGDLSSANGSGADLDSQQTPHESVVSSRFGQAAEPRDQSQHQHFAKRQVLADSRLHRTLDVPAACEPHHPGSVHKPPAVQLLSVNSSGAKFHINSSYKEEADFQESQKRPDPVSCGQSNQKDSGCNGTADPAPNDASSKSSGLSSIGSSRAADSSDRRDTDDTKRPKSSDDSETEF